MADEELAELGALATDLEALANPLRLQILDQLREPTGVTSIRAVKPALSDEGRPTPLSRQAVQWHLDQLAAAGLAYALPKQGRVTPWVVDHQRLFALVDRLRGVARFPATRLPEPERATLADITEGAVPPPPPGRRFYVSYGRDDGTTYRLPVPPAVVSVGREEGNDWVLNYDPYTSAEHARIHVEPDHVAIEDRGSANGMTINGVRAGPGQHQLVPGDVVTIGRTCVVFQGDESGRAARKARASAKR